MSAGDWQAQVVAAMEAFVVATELAGFPLAAADLEVEYHQSPHLPPSRLPPGKMALYGFWGDGEWLKIGMAGSKSQARYTSQHYNPNSAPSTLARSLLSDARFTAKPGFHREQPGDWIKANTHRLNILMDANHPRELLAFLEAFLHLRLKPRYER